jgi:hypothetical protein
MISCNVVVPASRPGEPARVVPLAGGSSRITAGELVAEGACPSIDMDTASSFESSDRACTKEIDDSPHPETTP